MHKRVDHFSKYLIFSNLGFAFFSVVSIAAVPLSFGLLNSENNLLAALALGTVATGLTFLLYRVLIAIFYGTIKKPRLLHAFSVLVILGTVRGILIYYGSHAFRLIEPSDLISRLYNSVATTLIWLSLSCALVETHRRYQRRYRAMISQLLITNARSKYEIDPSFDSVARELSLLQHNLRLTYSDASEAPSDAIQVRKAASEIKSQIDSALKPLSRRLWVSSLYESPQFRFWSVIRHSIANLKFNLIPLAAIYGLTATINYAVTLGLKVGVVRGISGTLFLIAAETVRRKVRIHSGGIQLTFNILYLISIGTLVNMVSTLSTNSLEWNKYLAFYLILAPEVGLLILAISAITLALSDREKILALLKKEVEDLELTSGPANVQVASYLHNSLQSELTAIATQFEQVATDPVEGKVEEILERLLAVVQRSMSEDFKNYLETPDIRFARILDSWRGLVEITSWVDPAIFHDDLRSTLFIQLAQEAIANAVRKGEASEITIDAHYGGDGLQVLISSNGSYDHASKSGMGTSWLERFAISDWGIFRDEGRTVLKVEL